MDNAQQHHAPADTDLAAEQEAESDAKKVRWFFIGFFGNILGILIASVYEPMPPASRLLGNSPEDAALYTDSYKAKSRKIQIHQSGFGLVTGFGFGILLAIIAS